MARMWHAEGCEERSAHSSLRRRSIVPSGSVAGAPAGDVPGPVAERVRVGVAQARVVAVAEEAGPGGEVGGEVRRGNPAAVDLPGLRWQPAQAHGLRGADAGGLDAGVLAKA